MVSSSMHIRTEHFDGPLGLLLFLLQKQDIDIREFDLTKVTRQYLAYLKQMKELNLDVAGDYLYLAVMLLLLKSRAVSEGELRKFSPSPGEGDDLIITSRSDLVRRLEELQHYQRLGKVLWMLPKQNHDIFCPSPDQQKSLGGIDFVFAGIGQIDRIHDGIVAKGEKELYGCGEGKGFGQGQNCFFQGMLGFGG